MPIRVQDVATVTDGVTGHFFPRAEVEDLIAAVVEHLAKRTLLDVLPHGSIQNISSPSETRAPFSGKTRRTAPA